MDTQTTTDANKKQLRDAPPLKVSRYSDRASGKTSGDVLLRAEGYMGTKSEFLGLFKLREEVVQGRPTYKMPGKEQFLFYTTSADGRTRPRASAPAGYWMVGPHTSKRGGEGFWLVNSAARTPDAITETWKVLALGVWTEVPTAQIVRAAVEEHEANDEGLAEADTNWVATQAVADAAANGEELPALSEPQQQQQIGSAVPVITPTHELAVGYIERKRESLTDAQHIQNIIASLTDLEARGAVVRNYDIAQLMKDTVELLNRKI